MKIKVENLEKKFGDVTIFSDVNLSFKDGLVYGLVGRNGSGKSVFLKTICGFLKPTKGTVTYDEIDIFKNDCFLPNTRVIIDKPNFLDEFTGFENLKLLASIQNKISDDKIRETIKLVDLEGEEDKKYLKYSLGMRQKLAIAQVLMEDPKIIILDEPFNGLDKKSYSKMMDIFRKEKEKGKLVIIATHIESDLENLCDEIYEVDDKKIYKK